MDEQKIEALRNLIKERAIVVDVNGITLSSGMKTEYYYDLKRITFDPIGIGLVADLLYDEIVLLGAKSVGGLEIGAIPIITGLLMKDANEGGQGHKLKGFVVRKQVKDHGLKHIVEGDLESPVVMVDDVLTTGASLKKAIDEVSNSGVFIKHVFCILDRQEKNNELKKNYYKYKSLFTHSDFQDFINKNLLISKLIRNLAS